MQRTYRLRTIQRAFTGWVLALGCVSAVQAVSTLDGNYQSVVVSDGDLVALDFQSRLYTSDDDGASFVLRKTADDSFHALGALGMTTIAVGVDGLILRAPDAGITWSDATAPEIFGALYAVAGRSAGANPNEWLAVGDDGFDGHVYRSTDDGVNWSSAALVANANFRDVIWTGNRWLACGSDSFLYHGLVYTSTDGTNWSAASVPAGLSALNSLASDGAGTVLAVGEHGRVLRSTDDGLTFVAIAPELLTGGDFTTVIADDAGSFYIGGDHKHLVQVDGSTASTLVPQAASSPTVSDLVWINGELTAVGAFPAAGARTIALELQMSVGGTLDYILSIEQALHGKTYYVETTTDLTADDWSLVPNSALTGNGAQLSFDVAADGVKRFWRIIEF